MTAEERACLALDCNFNVFQRLSHSHLDRVRIQRIAASLEAHARDAVRRELEELREWLDEQADATSMRDQYDRAIGFAIVGDEIHRRLKALEEGA